MSDMTEAQKRARDNYRKRVQNDDEKKWLRNKQISLRSARNHIRNYSDLETLNELKTLIAARENELKQKENPSRNG